MPVNILAFLCLLLLLAAMLLSVALGSYVGKKGGAHPGLSVTESAVFTLMSLLIAFTFANGATRFDQRRQVMIEEANVISTAYLRLNMLQDQDRLLLRKDFLEYVNSRLKIYDALPDVGAFNAAISASSQIQDKLWSDAITATGRSKALTAPMLILPAINSMFDIAKSRIVYSYLHPHYLIFVLLITVALLGGFLTGYGIATRGAWHSLHVIIFVFLTVLTIYIILDLEAPRYGLIQESNFDYLLEDLSHSMMTQVH